MLLNLALALATAATALPTVDKRQLAAGPAVTIHDGTVVGSTFAGIDTFKGIPFAQPPTGTLRLRLPQTLTAPYGVLVATAEPTACPQFFSQINTTTLPGDAEALLLDSPISQQIQNAGEDCLTLNVQRPAGTTSSSKLPVVFWIFGGGFEFGSTQTYDASFFINKSVALGEEVLYVATNYRLGGFGFLGGQQLKNEGNTNLGLHDQRLAMQWVQDNIAAFGGDPSRVTIWGESAGSISVFDHTIINGGDNTYKGKPLFHAAIMDSGSIVPTNDVASPRAQDIFNQVVAAAGCSSAPDALACLRALPYQTYLNAANSVPAIFGYRSLDLSYLPRPDNSSFFFPYSPEVPVRSGAFTRIPIIIGDQEDEGTLFSLTQANITNTNELITYLDSYFTNPAAPAAVNDLVATYPDSAPAGSPFRTGDLNEIYPEFKRLAAILGDIVFTLTRRVYLSQVAKAVPAWSYLSTYLYGTPILGTFHASDILEDYYDLVSPIAADSIMTYYISFINNLDPNAITTAAPLIPWPQWTNASGNPQLVNFGAADTTLLSDTFRESSFDVINADISVLHV